MPKPKKIEKIDIVNTFGRRVADGIYDIDGENSILAEKINELIENQNKLIDLISKKRNRKPKNLELHAYDGGEISPKGTEMKFKNYLNNLQND